MPDAYRVELKQVVGSIARLSVMVGHGALTALPDPVALRILRDGAGYSLLRLDKSGSSVTHTWHATLEGAMDRASTEYGIARDEWIAERRRR